MMLPLPLSLYAVVSLGDRFHVRLAVCRSFHLRVLRRVYGVRLRVRLGLRLGVRFGLRKRTSRCLS